MRTFIAIPLTAEIRGQLKDLEARLKVVTGSTVRWVSPEIIHLTLKFLGEIDPHSLDLVSSALEKIAAQTLPSTTEVKGTGVFPAWSRPRVLWAGINPPAELLTLSKRVDDVTAALGFPSENRPFNPHLTLGRLNEALSPAQINTLKEKMSEENSRSFGILPLDQIIFFQSILQPTGPVYKPISIHRLSSRE